jgi:hypothetical protein
MLQASRWAKQIQDTIADSSTVRDGLHDEEAMPLINWGTQQAIRISERMAAPELPPPDEQRISDMGYALVSLMTRITWLAVYRNKKDAAWLTRTFYKINDLSRELHGPDAPVFSDEEIAVWIAGHAGKSNSELVQNLIAHLTFPPSPNTTDTSQTRR